MTSAQSFVIFLGILLIGFATWENWNAEVRSLF